MIELTIFGRGGQGGVTLAKLVAQAFFLRGRHAQAFGVYAAERSGAPLQAYVRADDEEITNHNQIRTPDHVIVLDRTLIAPAVTTGLKRNGWVILNTAEPPSSFSAQFPGRRVATVDATAIALEHGLGTRTVPIVNTTMLGAVARVLDLGLDDVRAALDAVGFGGSNRSAATAAFDRVVCATLPGEIAKTLRPPASPPTGLLDERVGGIPTIRTGSWATRQPHRRSLTPPCNHACPAGNDIQAFVAAAGRGDHDAALRILLETSPFPGVCGRVCPAPCMEACNRITFDESVNIRELERYVADHASWEGLADHRSWLDLGVAVIGSGPAGLSAAYHLARLGYAVTLFEAGDELGGVMRTGIPEYRLPRTVLAREIEHVLDQGVEVRTGHPVARGELLSLTQRYAAVFVATGLQEARSLALAPPRGGSSERVMQGIEFLDRVRTGTISVTGADVVVVGGGNTAIDAARSARRMGAAHVRIAYRRAREQMPAIPEEIEAAIEEGICIDELVSPLRVRTNGRQVCLTCQRMRLGDPDESGRPKPVPEASEDAFFDLRCDRVILALGQSPDLSILPEGAEITRDGTASGTTGAPLFCGGDFASNDGTVAAAIGSGRAAALHVHKTLTGEDLFPPSPEPLAGPDRMKTHVFAHSPRASGDTIAIRSRRHTFEEVHTGFSEGDGTAVLEARRCFSCGVCNECDQCVAYCPEGILMHEADGYRFDYEYCKGCGVCASVCPRGVIYMTEL